MFKGERGTLDVWRNEVLTFLVMEGVPDPDAKDSVVVGEYLSHRLISDTFWLVELCEYAPCEDLLDSFQVCLREPGECVIFPVTVSEETVQVRVVVKRLTGSFCGEDCGELTIVNSKRL